MVAKILILMLMTIAMSSCGMINKIWGEDPPPQKVIVVESTALPSFLNIFDDDEEIALQTLKIWKEDLLNTFNQIEGEKQDFLSLAEIQTLIRKGYIKLSPDVDLTLRKVKGVLRLLGFKDGISKQNVENLITWLEDNRLQAKTFYRIFVSTELHNNPVTSRELVQVLQLFGSFISLGGSEPMVPAEMTEILTPWIPDHYVHAKKALESGIELGISFFASFCGDRVELHRWNGQKIGQCIQDLTLHFAASTPVADLIVGNLNPLTDRKRLDEANQQLVKAVSSWLDKHQHPVFPTARVAKLADKLEIPAPYAFFKLTEWIPKLNADSSERAFSPTFFIDLAKITQAWINNLLVVTSHEKCESTDWKVCEFAGKYEVADQLYNDEYATFIRSKTLGFVSKVSFYDSVSQFLMSKFDPKNKGLATDGIKDLITIAIRLIDSNAFAFNVLSRLQERPYDPSMAELSLQNIHRQGLAELAALAADLIPERGKNGRGF